MESPPPAAPVAALCGTSLAKPPFIIMSWVSLAMEVRWRNISSFCFSPSSRVSTPSIFLPAPGGPAISHLAPYRWEMFMMGPGKQSPAGHLQRLRGFYVHRLALVHQGELVELLDVEQRLGKKGSHQRIGCQPASKRSHTQTQSRTKLVAKGEQEHGLRSYFGLYLDWEISLNTSSSTPRIPIYDHCHFIDTAGHPSEDRAE